LTSLSQQILVLADGCPAAREFVILHFIILMHEKKDVNFPFNFDFLHENGKVIL